MCVFFFYFFKHVSSQVKQYILEVHLHEVPLQIHMSAWTWIYYTKRLFNIIFAFLSGLTKFYRVSYLCKYFYQPYCIKVNIIIYVQNFILFCIFSVFKISTNFS